MRLNKQTEDLCMETLIKVKTRQNVLALISLWIVILLGTIVAVSLEFEFGGSGFAVAIIALITIIATGICSFIENKIYAIATAALYALLTVVELLVNVDYIWDELYIFALIILPVLAVIYAILINSEGELEVTDKCVVFKKKCLFRKINIPVEKICCVQRGIFKSLEINAPSGKINAYGVEEIDEVYTTLCNLINDVSSNSVAEENQA